MTEVRKYRSRIVRERCEFEEQEQNRDENFRARHRGKRGTGRDAERDGYRGREWRNEEGSEAEMEELVRVAHGRYGCKSAYETYKRFARTNTRPGVRPRRWEGREEERTGGREARGGRREELGPQWIQMRINIYKRVRRCGVPFSIPPESGCERRCEEILVLAPPCEMRNTRRKNEEESSEY